jgi:predicted RNase H-like HicB family nuclease
VEYDPDDDVYNVEVPAFPGCFTWGKTLPEALASATDAIAGYLDGLRQDGEAIPVENIHPVLGRSS